MSEPKCPSTTPDVAEAAAAEPSTLKILNDSASIFLLNKLPKELREELCNSCPGEFGFKSRLYRESTQPKGLARTHSAHKK